MRTTAKRTRERKPVADEPRHRRARHADGASVGRALAVLQRWPVAFGAGDLLALQRAAGNGAVSAALALQRRAHRSGTSTIYVEDGNETDTLHATRTVDGDGPSDAGVPAGAPPGCNSVTGTANLPSGTLPATLNGGKLGADWNMSADFTGDPPVPAICGPCGEYRQYVKGTFTKNGSAVRHDLCGTPLDPSNYNEDCGVFGGRQLKYGYHSIQFANSNFSRPDQATGFRWDGYDYPGIRGSSGDQLGVSLQFMGSLIDTCNGATLGGSTWSVEGTATVP